MEGCDDVCVVILRVQYRGGGCSWREMKKKKITATEGGAEDAGEGLRMNERVQRMPKITRNNIMQCQGLCTFVVVRLI